MGDYPVEEDEFQAWCEGSDGHFNTNTNAISGVEEIVCTFDAPSEKQGAREKVFMDENGYIFANDNPDKDGYHKFRSYESVWVSDGEMRIDVRNEHGDNNHVFDFSE